MARRVPPARGGRALRLSVVVLTTLVTGFSAHAQPVPAPDTPAPVPDDLERAKDLYRSGEAAMKDGRFDDAARDYAASYELSGDPALFFKLGHAHQRGGKCEIALNYYARYLREGNPTEQFAVLTRERIAACRGGVSGTNRAAPEPAPAAHGNATPGSASAETTAPVGPPAIVSGAAAGSTGSSATTGSAAAGSAATPVPIPPTRQKIAWLAGGSAIALVALGGVLAYAARSSENDIRDLYAGFAGQIPAFDAQTRQRYNDLVDEGRRYQHLSWTAFGLAGAAALGAAVLFTTGGQEPAQPARITPVITPHGGGIAVGF